MAFSGWRVLKEGLSGHRGWTPLWRAATPKKEYDLIIIGGWRSRTRDRLLFGEIPRRDQSGSTRKRLGRWR
jgi:hypothetical protein